VELLRSHTSLARSRDHPRQPRQDLPVRPKLPARVEEKLEGLGLSEEEVRRALEPMLSFRAQLEEEVEWYERVRRRDFGIIRDLSAVGTLLIALRIANGLSQRELAEKLGVSEAQVSRDERNEYHGITVDRAQRVLDAMNETLTSRVEDKPLALA
jgi:DNA-directed RNA polymerase specialized sigma subunit